jgi:hypothetical protein
MYGRINREAVRTLEIFNGAKNIVSQALQFQWIVVCRKLPGWPSISHEIILMIALWRVNLLLALDRSLLNREYILINILKALAAIISMCNLHVNFLLMITPRYVTVVTI